jgi:GDP-L-fucose synthase
MALSSGRVFLAGATGMAGSAIMRKLLESFPDITVRAARFRSRGVLPDNPRIEWVQADLRRQEDCRRAVAGCDCAVMSAASTAGSRGMAAEPWHALDDNVIMNTQMLEAFHVGNVRRLVFLGSATVYQEFEGAIRENQLDLNRDPHSAYMGVGWGMRFVEKLCRFWFEKTDMEILIARAANIFGPFAAFDPKTSNVIPALIRKAVDKMDPFEVWGTPDVVRDVIYCDDLAAAVVRMLAADEIKFDVFNVGTGRSTTVGEMVRWALDAAGHQPSRVEWIGESPATTRRRLLDCGKIRDILKWQPVFSVEEGIRETTDWWIRNRGEWTK